MRKTHVKIINQGEKMPEDFWNYLVNPIVGYYFKSIFSLQDNLSYTTEIYRTKGKRDELRKSPTFKNKEQ